MKKFILLTIVVAIIGAVFCGCGSNSSRIEGKWYEEHGYLMLDIGSECEVNYYLSEENSVSKDFEYEVLEDAFVISNNNGKEIPLKLVFAEDEKTIESLEYTVNDEKIIFTRTQIEPASINDDLLLAMDEAKLKHDEYKKEGDNAKALEALLSFSDEKILYNSINAFMDELNDLD